MRAKLSNLWESIHTSLWFFPSIIAALGVGAAYGIIQLDRSAFLTGSRLEHWFYLGGPEGARLVLSTIAGSTITVVGVAFSITIAALAMAGSQFGPRLLRSFMADKGNQTVLGTFISTFIYCLIVLRTIRDDSDVVFVPDKAVTFGIILALFSFGILIYFFHHVSSSMQAEHVVNILYRELIAEIDRTFPPMSQAEHGPVESKALEGREGPHAIAGGLHVMVHATESGYLRALDAQSLLSLATERNVVIRVQYRPGDFVFEKNPITIVEGRDRLDEPAQKRIRRAFAVGEYRSLEQDVEFPIQQLVDMALRALSPSLNDPYTAVNCIDRLGAAICHLCDRQTPPPRWYDKDGRLRLILDVPTYEGIVDAAFNQIRQSAADNIAASIRLLEALQAIAVVTSGPKQRKVIRRHAEMIHHACQKALTEQKDRDDIEERFREVLQRLGDAVS
jgi:uncharacterized membrane protein